MKLAGNDTIITKTKSSKLLRIATIFLLLFLSAGAFYGGLSFIIDPTGAAIQMPFKYLESTPFNSYLIPGIVLLISNGISALVIMVLVVIQTKGYNKLVFLQGVVLFGWLSIQLFMNPEFYYPAMHISCYTIAVLLITISLRK